MDKVLFINDLVVAAVSKLVDDSQAGAYREPSHSDIQFCIDQAGLKGADPKQLGQTVGKAKRVRAVLSWALEHDRQAGGRLVAALITQIRAAGGFRTESDNFVGQEQITSAVDAFSSVGYSLGQHGDLQPKDINLLSGRELTRSLRAYADRAKHGSSDAALLVGTSKDLLEATAAHVLTEKYGSYSPQANFPTLLGQAFIALGLATPEETASAQEAPTKPLERNMYITACAINRLRNKDGTGHGRPWSPTIDNIESRAAAELAGVVAGYMLAKL